MLIRFHKIYRLAGLSALLMMPLPIPAAAQSASSETMTELVVTSQRREQPRLLHAGNIERIGAATIASVQHHHIHELLSRVAGVWITRASGQEHLTAIRSPVLTGGGSCGAFLFLEDSIPIRPAGFCNVNSLFEINTEQARSIEVIRGPGNALYGSNALHGIINTLMPMPGPDRLPQLALEIGANDFHRVRADVPFDRESPWLATLVYADDGGFRDDSGYQQGKLHVKRQWQSRDSELTVGLSASDLDQDTAGFIIGEDSYKDDTVNRSNLNPEAFRVASSQRLYGIWTKSLPHTDIDVRPFLRHSDMRFLQHFLPGQPLEENGHVSAGVIATAAFGDAGSQTIVGVDIEWSDMFLQQSQDGPTEGSAFLMETRPQGKHYDYDVSSVGVAAYAQSEYELNKRLTIDAGLRIDHIRYDYTNRMLAGNTRDDGSECGFGGCLYSRPASRSDDFTNIAPKLSITYRLSDSRSLFASAARGFRAPQATELYRLQSGQQLADLDSERVDALEIGVRTNQTDLSVDVALFTMRKRDSVFRDAEGFNVTGARSKHRGIELSLDWQVAADWSLAIDASYARHTYDFDAVAARGETFVSGADVDTAPRWLGSAEVQFEPNDAVAFGLQWTAIDKYYVDAENQFQYPGHSIASLRAQLQLASQLDLVLRLNNITDRKFADRADYAFGDFRYFPGRGRELFAEIRYTPKESL
ncbi:MAG: TonB-dependent receptor [Gammaproteobacteria bacterium]|nr:TonB-dependent receptor [Gammaproteobacteria bacterium]MDH3431668.1 TonB-dependent receptor [Gammaproteobacteria bacterium]